MKNTENFDDGITNVAPKGEFKSMRLSDKMYHLNRTLSAVLYIQKLKTKQEAEAFLQRINQEIGNWIKEVRELEGGKD